jgi:hypothetical protein
LVRITGTNFQKLTEGAQHGRFTGRA